MIPKISLIPLRQLAGGDWLSLQVYQFQGTQPGPKVYLQSNLHGAEISGNAVISQLIEFLVGLEASQLRGEIWLVPVCNPVSVATRTHHFATGRYHLADGKDWNRIFWDYEKDAEEIKAFALSQLSLAPETIIQNYRALIRQGLAKQFEKLQAAAGVPYPEFYRVQLQALSWDADYVLDLHSSSNQALDYLYCFHGREESAKAFLLNWGVFMGPGDYDGDAFDEAFFKPWLALERNLAELGKVIQFDIESWTLELGPGMQMNPESVAKGIRGIKNYLAWKKVLQIEGFPLPETASHQIALTPKNQIQRYYAPAGGMIQERVQLGSFVKSGERLYQILSFNKMGELPRVIEVCATQDGIVFDIGTNASVNQWDYVLGTL